MIKQLDLWEPAVTTYPKHANISSILGKAKNFNNWLYTNHIQLFCAEYIDKMVVHTYLDTYEPLYRVYYPFLEKKCVSKDFFKRLNINIIDFVQYCIDNDYYIYACIDTFHIPLYKRYTHENHDIFLYGYDLEKNEFMVADFFDLHYSKERISFSSFVNALNSSFTDENTFKDVQMLKIDLNQDSKEESLDIDFIKSMLDDYIKCCNSSYKYKEFEKILPDEDNRTWGLNVYNSLTKALSYDNIPTTTLRSLHALYEHKKLMVSRIEYINNNYVSINRELLEEVKKIERHSLVTRNSLIKFSRTNSLDLKQKIINNLIFIKDRENTLISNILNCI